MENKDFSAQFFLSNLSHEIRTPLNGIVGYSQLLMETRLDNNQKIYLNSISKCSIQLMELVNDILDYSKLATGKSSVNNECFSLKEIFEEVTSAISFRIKEKKQSLKFQTDDTIPEYVVCDKQKIIQILINLISNANKFTNLNGRIIVSVSLENNFLNFTVEDNGIGISTENQEKIFIPFVQINETSSKQGCGLGLAITKKLVELLGGNISVESDINKGSVFSFKIKCEIFDEYQKFLEKNSEILKGKYVLIADENIEDRILLGEILFEYGMKPIICSSAKEAVRMINKKRYPFSLILIDYSLSGIDFTKQIYNIPIIVMSNIKEIDPTLSNHVIYKPINRVKILDILCKTFCKNDISQYELNPPEKKKIVEKTELKILIAEDVLYNSEMISKMLKNMGYKNIDISSNGEEAIKKMEEIIYDVIILDLKMPKIDGFGVIDYIEKKKYETKIVVITASILEIDKEKCKQKGINYFLLKPFNVSHLEDIMNKIV